MTEDFLFFISYMRIIIKEMKVDNNMFALKCAWHEGDSEFLYVSLLNFMPVY